MMCGIYYCLLRKGRGQPIKFEMLFKGFDYFVQSLIATLLMMVPILAVVIPGYAVVFGVLFASMPMTPRRAAAPPPAGHAAFFVAYFAFLAVLLAVAMAVSRVVLLRLPADHRPKAVGGPGHQDKPGLGRANLGGLVGLVLLNFLMTLIGMLACYVGAFFVMPIHFAAVAVAYRQVFPRTRPRAAPDGRRGTGLRRPARPRRPPAGPEGGRVVGPIRDGPLACPTWPSPGGRPDRPEVRPHRGAPAWVERRKGMATAEGWRPGL